MKCARCSAEIPRQSQFCLRCGNPVSAAYNPAPGATSMPVGVARPSANRNLMIVIAVLALALVGVLGAVVGGKLLQKPGQTDTGQMVQAPGAAGPGTLVQAPAVSNPAPIVQAPGDTQPPTVVQAPSQPTINTTDIDDYLKFLRQVEESKTELTKRELAGALSMYGNMTSKEAEAAQDDDKSKAFLPDVNKTSEDFPPEWDKLAKLVHDRPAPTACARLKDSYQTYLGKVEAQFVEVHTALAKASTDAGSAISSLTAMLGAASADADRAAKDADNELANVCAKYHLSKDFDIKTDSSSYSGLLR